MGRSIFISFTWGEFFTNHLVSDLWKLPASHYGCDLALSWLNTIPRLFAKTGHFSAIASFSRSNCYWINLSHPYWIKTATVDFCKLLLRRILHQQNHSPLTGVGGNHLVTFPNFKMDTEEAPNQAPRAFDESQSMSAAYRCPYRTQFLFYAPKQIASRRLLLSDTPIVDSTVPVYEFDCQSWLGHHFRRLTTIRPQPFSLDIIVSVPLFITVTIRFRNESICLRFGSDLQMEILSKSGRLFLKVFQKKKIIELTFSLWFSYMINDKTHLNI